MVATGTSLLNPTPAVTASGDGIVGWWDSAMGSPSCPATAIRGALQHHGTWSPAQDLGPGAWPDISTLSNAAVVYSAGNDISVPILTIHKDGSPCPTGFGQTRSLIVRHFRSGVSGLTDEGTSVLAPPITGPQPTMTVNGWAMESGGKVLAWYTAGPDSYLRSFDGVTPGGGSGGTTTPPVTTPPPGPAPISAPAPPPIKPLVLQRFVTILPIDPSSLNMGMECPRNSVNDDTCAARAYAYYVFTGKNFFTGKRAAAKKPKPTLIASGALTLKQGRKGHLKLKPNKAGKALLKAGKKLKITLKITVTQGAQSASGTFATSIKARKKRKKR